MFLFKLVLKYIDSLPKEISVDLMQYRSLTKKVEYILNDFKQAICERYGSNDENRKRY